jgi:enoyl-CoA hydratase/carnithine racemase
LKGEREFYRELVQTWRGITLKTPEKKKGVRAFLEKRKPNFSQ